MKKKKYSHQRFHSKNAVVVVEWMFPNLYKGLGDLVFETPKLRRTSKEVH